MYEAKQTIVIYGPSYKAMDPFGLEKQFLLIFGRTNLISLSGTRFDAEADFDVR